MVIMSVRKIPHVQAAFKKLSFIDKVYFCNYGPPVVSGLINEYLEDHGSRYTHVLVSSDDITPSPDNIHQLINDVREYDLSCVAGWCNICYFNRQDEKGVICGDCVDEQPHEDSNVTFDPVDTTQLCRKSYNFVKVSWAQEHQSIYPVWFQGMACGMVSMETHDQIPFRSLMDGVGGLMQDLAFALDCKEKGIQQFVDFRVGMRHYGTHHGCLLVGKEPTSIRFEKAKHA
jgi:hypothetical protein